MPKLNKKRWRQINVMSLTVRAKDCLRTEKPMLLNPEVILTLIDRIDELEKTTRSNNNDILEGTPPKTPSPKKS